MAKSLRSKWRRKCRAVKRVRYGQKELERLKKTLGITDEKKDVDMQEVSEIANIVDAQTVQKAAENNSQEDKMDMDDTKSSCKKFLNKAGSYPVWFPQRKIKAAKRAAKKGKVGKKGKKHR